MGCRWQLGRSSAARAGQSRAVLLPPGLLRLPRLKGHLLASEVGCGGRLHGLPRLLHGLSRVHSCLDLFSLGAFPAARCPGFISGPVSSGLHFSSVAGSPLASGFDRPANALKPQWLETQSILFTLCELHGRGDLPLMPTWPAERQLCRSAAHFPSGAQGTREPVSLLPCCQNWLWVPPMRGLSEGFRAPGRGALEVLGEQC